MSVHDHSKWSGDPVVVVKKDDEGLMAVKSRDLELNNATNVSTPRHRLFLVQNTVIMISAI